MSGAGVRMVINAASSSPAARPSILGRGCDPVRANFAKTNWGPALNADIDVATSDEELMAHITKGKKYDVFFFAPGQVGLIQSGRVDGAAVEARVREHQPGIRILYIQDVSKALPMLSEALNQQPAKVLAPNTEDWPFVD